MQSKPAKSGKVSNMKRFGKGGFEFLTNWVELLFFGLLVLGFAAGKLIIDLSFSYLLVAAAGLIAGRLSYVKRENDPLPFKAISLAFLIGYLFGHRAGNGVVITLLFVAAVVTSYKAHQSFDFLA